ncbi:glycoside hydrolase [Parachaetomium inaequale]|uniref:Glycoside hydrolase n=1 Tax=Parachaetomium inaequale TaxID=2588326 RepID=A0AAN6PQ33_9PEZI|nr:glycoside hydrolase [Parachaetomium inaequale]
MKPFLSLAGFCYLSATQGLAYSVDARYHNAGPVPDACSDGPAAGQFPSEITPLRPRQDLDIRAAAKAAIDALNNKFYSPAQAIWSPGDPWWLSGVALTSVIDYMRKTGSRDYMDQIESIIQVQRTQWSQDGADFRAESTDDTGWWALAMIRMYDLTGDSTYLNISIEDEAYMYKYWTSSPCGGGIYVDIKAKTYKNAIANELYIKLAASLHNRIANDTRYLSRAETAWSWFQNSGMINQSDNLINDGLASSSSGACSNNKLPVWTYNQGVILGALAELFRATNSETYLTSARSIADAVLSTTTTPQLTNPNTGTLTEASCKQPDEGCNHDQQVFKGVFAYSLAELDGAVSDHGGGHPYVSYIRQNAQSAYANARGEGTDLYDVSWAGPFLNSTVGKQASAVGLLIAGI